MCVFKTPPPKYIVHSLGIQSLLFKIVSRNRGGGGKVDLPKYDIKLIPQK